MRTEHRDQASFCPFALREVSVLAELALGHLRYSLTDVPPQSNSPPGIVLESDHAGVVNRRFRPPGVETHRHSRRDPLGERERRRNAPAPTAKAHAADRARRRRFRTTLTRLAQEQQ